MKPHVATPAIIIQTCIKGFRQVLNFHKTPAQAMPFTFILLLQIYNINQVASIQFPREIPDPMFTPELSSPKNIEIHSLNGLDQTLKPELFFTKNQEPLDIPIPNTIILLNYLLKQGDSRQPSRFRISKYHKPDAKYTKQTKFGLKQTKFGPKQNFERLTAHRALGKFHGQTSKERMFCLKRFFTKQKAGRANRFLKNL